MSSPAASATDLRYQRSCVLAQNGTVTRAPSQAGTLESALHDTLTDPLHHLVRYGRQEVGLRDVGDEGGVEAHDVDRVVLGREAPHELLPLF